LKNVSSVTQAHHVHQAQRFPTSRFLLSGVVL
jgi:hypothetical protein